MALLDIRNLTVEIKTTSGKIKIIDNVNLSIEHGEMMGLVGESGSGKSIIANIICNAIKENWVISADRFRFNNVELLKLKPNQRRKLIGSEISMVFQNPTDGLDPATKIGKQLVQSILPWSYKGKWWRWFGWKKRHIVELLHRVGIKDHHQLMKLYPHEIHEQDAQKVMIAMAVTNQPKLLIADEAINTLELSTQLQIFRLLTSMNQNNGTSVLLVSNDIQNIAPWVNALTVLYCGQNAERGPKDCVLARPYHPYTRALINSIPDFSQPLPVKSHLNTLRGTIPMLEHLPIGCRLGPRCPFAQKVCINAPNPKRVKQHEFNCYFPINAREHSQATADHQDPIIIHTLEDNAQ